MKMHVLAAALVLSASMVAGQPRQAPPPSQQGTNQGNASGTSEGERLFEVNCGRCHRPPDQLSPKIVGTVLRHMRVRAMLSEEDQKQILKYLAP